MNKIMNEVIEYTKKWLLAMESGRRFDGHDFYSGFPHQFKKLLGIHVNTLYYNLNLIDKHCKDKTVEGYYDFLEDETLKKSPWRENNKEFTWSLWSCLKIINEQLTKENK